jgi:hypothetical protein
MIEDKEEETAKKVSEMEGLCQYLQELEQTVDEKEARVDQLSMEIAQYHKRQEQARNDIERGLAESKLYKKFKSRFKKGGEFNKAEYEKLNEMAEKLLPGFHKFISSKRHSLTDSQYYLCLLFRFHLDVNQSATLLGVSPSYVSKISKDILLKLFGEKGNGLLLRKKLEAINE